MPSQTQSVVDRVRNIGVAHAHTFDLAAIAFTRHESDVDAAQAGARTLMVGFRSIEGILDMDTETFKAKTGMEGFEVLRCQALIELGRRAGKTSKGSREEICTSDDVSEMFDHLRHEKKEHFCCVLLDSKQHVLSTRTIHVGTLGMSIVGAREIFREAIREGASSIIVVHNHPSGDPTPSPEDLDVTDRLVEAGKLVDIPVLDHVIIGDLTHVSLKQRGGIQ